MNDWKGDVTPVLTACGGEAYERGANITTPELRYMYPVGTSLPHTYPYALSSANINSNQPTTSSSTPFSPSTSLLIIHSEKGTLARHRPDRMHVACRERCPG